MAKKTKKDRKPKTPKNKTTEERLSKALEIVARGHTVLGHAEVFIKRMQELAGNLRYVASFLERDKRTLDRNDMANTLCEIANIIETAMDV